MTLGVKLARLRANYFVALILDNEVTVGEFVVDPPLPWARLIQRHGVFQIAEGYPSVLTTEQAKGEIRHRDERSLPGLVSPLPALGEAVDYVLIGNNAGQG